jgi:hypothetical protein
VHSRVTSAFLPVCRWRGTASPITHNTSQCTQCCDSLQCSAPGSSTTCVHCSDTSLPPKHQKPNHHNSAQQHARAYNHTQCWVHTSHTKCWIHPRSIKVAPFYNYQPFPPALPLWKPRSAALPATLDRMHKHHFEPCQQVQPNYPDSKTIGYSTSRQHPAGAQGVWGRQHNHQCAWVKNAPTFRGKGRQSISCTEVWKNGKTAAYQVHWQRAPLQSQGQPNHTASSTPCVPSCHSVAYHTLWHKQWPFMQPLCWPTRKPGSDCTILGAPRCALVAILIQNSSLTMLQAPQ